MKKVVETNSDKQIRDQKQLTKSVPTNQKLFMLAPLTVYKNDIYSWFLINSLCKDKALELANSESDGKSLSSLAEQKLKPSKQIEVDFDGCSNKS